MRTVASVTGPTYVLLSLLGKQVITQRNDMSPADGSSTGGAYRWCSRLANASEAAPFRPLLLTSWFDFLLVLCSNHSSKGHGTDRQTDRRTERTQHCLMTPVVGIIQRDSQTFVVMSICCGLVVYDKLQTIQQIDNKSKRWSLSHTNQQRSSRFHSNRCRRSRCMR